MVGPSPQGEALDCTAPIVFPEAKMSYGPWRQAESGEEILMRDPPCKRYGVGVLYPKGTPEVQEIEEPSEEGETPKSGPEAREVISEEAMQAMDEIEKRADARSGESESDDFDLSATATFRPSSMGLSFLAECVSGSVLVVHASGGRYRPHKPRVEGKERLWWLRSSVIIQVEFPADTLCTPNEERVKGKTLVWDNLEELDLRVEVFSRPYQKDGLRLITVCLVNRKEVGSQPDQYCLFQAFFKVEMRDTNRNMQRSILPYPSFAQAQRSTLKQSWEEEEQSLALLYRKANTFAVGHGCAANWESTEGTWQSGLQGEDFGEPEDVTGEKVGWVSADPFPWVETPSITPDITQASGTTVEVAMAQLAGLDPENDGFAALDSIVNLYSGWIEERRLNIPRLPTRYRAAAIRHIEQCRRCLSRMQDGLRYLEDNPDARRAFQLANHAMLLQQVRSESRPRKTQYDSQRKRFTFSEEYKDPEIITDERGRGKWRAFQIAFLLMTVQSTADADSAFRKTVELIWFPTGGGKTEAYLGLAAFALFLRRKRSPEDVGVQVLMRYTLRLLTAQQFQRASRLICAMEYLRRRNVGELGTEAFSIGIWLGGSVTPNWREDALRALNEMRKTDRFAENQFLLSQCPWCRAQMGPIKSGRRSRLAPVGYQPQDGTVVFQCPDIRCEFTAGLPVYVIDEDIYKQRPSILIGTVDKFALLAWREDCRALFGIDEDGVRYCSPPSLIIQDELHLISGPLGSMVGLYETVIEELCTDRRGNLPISPKIVSSTATIRRYVDQIKALYARDDVVLFPPPGLGADDSFFARYARDSTGLLQRGRIYVGVHAPGLGSLQTTQIRAFTTLLQAPLALPMEQRDPWWTLLLFFNSLRELGTTLSLFQSDIPDYFRVLMSRMGLDFSQLRRFWNVLELTGRLRNEEVPEAISKLEVKYGEGKPYPVDVCLASNIIEVGIDIDRLSLMAVVGQPKTTSQYTQVTGRVGRRWFERPGLVVTLYSASKPRDRSHFEKFRSYHERLYAQVEPTSVTPFSPPVLDRALHALMIAYVRQVGDRDRTRSPYPYPERLIEQLRQILLPRVRAVDEMEVNNFERVFARRAAEWRDWQRKNWQDRANEEIPLLRRAGAYASPAQARLSWSVAQSMRDVDAQCEAIITALYAMERETDNG
jgi:Helicase conserved C-terminal domain